MRLIKQSKRVNAAACALLHYARCMDKPSTSELALNRRGYVIDLLADLRHYADAHGIDFDSAARMAQQHYLAESTPHEVSEPSREPWCQCCNRPLSRCLKQMKKNS
jgi:hypothetical protein